MKNRRLNRKQLPRPEVYYRDQLHSLQSGHGKWARALCPFHEDHHPSLSVNLDHGGWRCFACGESGDLIRFHSLLYGMTFVEAVDDLGGWSND